jgi:pimeloyl-ACP methyl ester carboxylesterase
MTLREKMMREAFHPQKRNFPFLCVHGRHDNIFHIENTHKYREIFTGSRQEVFSGATKFELLILEDAGHVILPRHFEKVASKIASLR